MYSGLALTRENYVTQRNRARSWPGDQFCAGEVARKQSETIYNTFLKV